MLPDRAAVRDYEREAIVTLCRDVLPHSTLSAVLDHPDDLSLKFTGAGYYLELQYREIPDGRVVCDFPHLVGTFEEQEVGFVAFIEGGCLTLECYSFGNVGVPEEIREGVVSISAT